ncbi:MAG: lipoprotein signal peptidase [Gammaproteobacteria bacterium]|mgnify:FL=1|jgi:signal peptidase II|nr:MAG: lipoprotein signal peptidase [Gammaproteobacteria bacterium]
MLKQYRWRRGGQALCLIMKTTTTSFLIIFLVVLDQISKILISSYLSLGESLNLLPFLNFTLIHNSGIAFSFFDDGGNISRWLLVVAVSGILAYLLFLMYKITSKNRLELMSFILIISGGLGNLVDRVFLGYVVDFVHVFYQDYSFYVFNMADSYITVGIILYLSYFFFIERTEKT